MSDDSGQGSSGKQEGDEGKGLSEEEVRERLREELRKLKVEDVVLQASVTLINLGFHRLGLTEETEQERDLGQAEQAIEALRNLVPIAESTLDERAKPLKDAVSQLQLQYSQLVSGAKKSSEEKKGEGQEPKESGKAEEPGGSKKKDSHLWTPPGSK